MKFMLLNRPDPGIIRHVAVVAAERKCFLFMVPKRGKVKEDFVPVYRWLGSLSK